MPRFLLPEILVLRTTFAFLVLVSLPAALSAQSFDVDVPPKRGEKYKSAEFRLWIPEGLKSVRAILVRQHGCGRNGIDHSDDLQWQTLAAKHGAALMGSRLTYADGCGDWCVPANGTERAFLDALEILARDSRHPELTAVPWAIWGHSGGAIWGCHFADRFPHRVVGVWARSGATAEYSEAARAVPIVFNYGGRESVPKNQFESVYLSSIEAFEKYRPLGAPWSLAVDPKSWHDCRESRSLAVLWFDRVLAERLPKDGVRLVPCGAKRWRGDAKTLAVAAETGAEPGTSCWLPDAAYAEAWAEYCKTGAVADTTPPDAPTAVEAVVSARGVEVRWKAVADMESGTAAFAVVRDGKTVAEVGSPKTQANPKGRFQTADYGDEPTPRKPPMVYVDADGRVGAKYEIVQINLAGLRSKPSAPATGK